VLAGYQFMLGRGWLELVLATSHAGLWGALSWGALLMIATVFADVRQQPARWFPLAFALLALGGALAFVFPVSKHRMSVSFDLLVSGSAAIVFAATAALVKARGPLRALVTWGQNPLVLYVSHLVLLAVFLVPEAPWWHVDAGLALTTVQGVAFIGALHLWARLLERRQIFIAL
jgi:predicted acyltransferase